MTWDEAIRKAFHLARVCAQWGSRFYVSSYMQNGERVWDVRCAGPRGPKGSPL